MIQLFNIEKKPTRGLLWAEWAMLLYMALTLVLIFFCYTKEQNPQEMIWGRMRILAITIAMWAVYRMVPCAAMRYLRLFVLMALLSWWYPDTYEINRMFPNLDHIFASWEQQWFGMQPALLFSERWPGSFLSELMDLGYAAYYPMIFVVLTFYFVRRYSEFERMAFIVAASFFAYYVIFIFVPVVGPTFYYKAIGIEQAAQGVFPALHDYFNTHTECLASPGDPNGLFYRLVESAKEAGERPTAAFPSSHVGISTVLMLEALHSRNRVLTLCLLPFYVLLCLSTVYIQAHYAVDALAGLATGVLFYALFWAISARCVLPADKQRRLKK